MAKQANVFDKYARLPRVGLFATICEVATGREYMGLLEIDSSAVLKYELGFDEDFRKFLDIAATKPLEVLKRTDFILMDRETSKEVEVEDYSLVELESTSIGGAKAILEGNYVEYNGMKMGSCRTKIHLTESIERILREHEKRAANALGVKDE
ncbi:MAG: hypothetical protein MUF61_01655 [archaeon]|jgi:hypothetical protein|nr:hypothetical protein [archaeon]